MDGAGASSSGPPEGYVAVGRVGRSHGLRGAFRVRIDRPLGGAELLAAAERVWIDGLGDARVVSFAPHGRDHLLSVDRVRRVELAKGLLHAVVHVPPSPDAIGTDASGAVPAPGTPVYLDDAPRPIGTVEGVDGTPLQPLLRIATATGPRYLPAHAPYVRIDDDAVRLSDPPEGLLDEA